MQVVTGAGAAPVASYVGVAPVLARVQDVRPKLAPTPVVVRRVTVDLPARPKKRKKPKRGRVGLSAFEERRLKDRLRGNHAALANPDTGQPYSYTCSEPWVDAQVRSFDDVDADGEPIVYRFFDPGAFPPGREKTAMRRCRGCGRVTPPQNVGSSGHCDDCRIGAMPEEQARRLGRSGSVIDFARLKATRRRGGGGDAC